ncbi:putative lipoprotein LprC [Mycobacteroides abscessus subsp. abscessus]|nr:putative lipoprotein LprC [Mycobacteroides abscessus subsp. abscessus]
MHRKTKSLFAAACVALVAFGSAGCGGTVDGEAVMPGKGDSAEGPNAEQKYPNLLKECEVLTTDVLAKAVGRRGPEGYSEHIRGCAVPVAGHE